MSWHRMGFFLGVTAVLFACSKKDDGATTTEATGGTVIVVASGGQPRTGAISTGGSVTPVDNGANKTPIAKKPAKITANVASKNFGTLGIATSSTSNVLELTNSGETDATVLTGSVPTGEFRYLTSHVFPGYYYIEAESCTGKLAPGATCKINLEFAPVTVGHLTSSTIISYNDGSGSDGTASKTVTISLSGDGLAHGQLVDAFGTAGYYKDDKSATTFDNERFEQASVDPYGNLLLTGTWYDQVDEHLRLRRFKYDGTPDFSFGSAGLYALDAVALCSGSPGPRGLASKTLDNGTILVAFACDEYRGGILRLTNGGVLDPSYGNLGVAYTYWYGAGLTNGLQIKKARFDDANNVYFVGKTLATPAAAGIAKFTADGALDTSFNSSGFRQSWPGIAVPASFDDVAIDGSGVLYVVGHVEPSGGGAKHQVLVAKVSASGALVPSFDGDGLAYLAATAGVHNAAKGVGFDPYSGDLLVGGSVNYGSGDLNDEKSFLVRVKHVDGSLDSSFGSQILSIPNQATRFGSMLADPYGQVVVATVSPTNGNTNTLSGAPAIFRRHAYDGLPDEFWGANGLLKYATLDSAQDFQINDVVLDLFNNYCIAGNYGWLGSNEAMAAFEISN